MSKIGHLLLIWTICEGVLANREDSGFVQPLDFGDIFENTDSGSTSLASNPIAAAVLKLDKSLYPQLFDTVVSSSIDSLQRRLAPAENSFSADNFGFNPIASQGFLPQKSAKFTERPKQHTPQNAQLSPLRYDIRTVHDADYKVYKPEEDAQGEEILAALKKDPNVAAYFQPAVTTVEVSHPLNYRKEELNESPEVEQNYRPNAYITGSPRIRRYTSGRQRENLRKSSEEDDPYNYKVEYISRPKAFDSPLYSSAYKEENNPKKDYEYPYGYDSGYDHKEYERIKQLSEKQAAEIKQNPGNCKEVQKDGMTCTTCKDPKTGGNYESCSYVAEPKNNKYAYSKERKFDSNDEPDEPEEDSKAEQPNKSAKYQEEKKNDEPKYAKLTAAESAQPYSSYKNDDKHENDSGEKYKAYYIHSSKPTPSEELRAASNEEDRKEETESLVKPYNYKKALPGFYTDNEQKKDVEHVLAEFKKKDRSTCKKVQKNGMTCYQCIDNTGLKNEECMFVSESAPKRSHLAYQELKEFTSKPATINEGNESAESQTVTTSAPAFQKSAALVVDNTNYGKKLKRKKAGQIQSEGTSNPSATASNINAAVISTQKASKTKRSAPDVEITEAADEIIIAPEEFAGINSKGAFWVETAPRYSAALGVTLPEYMLARSEHEVSFDETIAGA